MAAAFKCDKCDKLQAGKPLILVWIGTQYELCKACGILIKEVMG